MLHQMQYYTCKQEFYCQDSQDDYQSVVQMNQVVLSQQLSSMELLLHLINHQLQCEQFQVWYQFLYQQEHQVKYNHLH